MSIEETPICTAIITAPRPHATIAKSLLSFDIAGFSLVDTMVFADGPCDLDGVSVKRNAVKLGNKGNWMNALGTMLTIANCGEYPYPWLMVCEDDIHWCENAASALTYDLQHKGFHSRIRCISLFLPRRHAKMSPVSLMHGYHFEGMQAGKKTWGAQCMLFRLDWARQLWADELFQQYRRDPNKDKNIDGIVGEVINNQGNVIAWRVPSLVHHKMGEGNSTLGYAPLRPDLLCDHYKGYP